MIDQFASYDLFGRDNYEYYARVTGRVLRVKDEWICSFRYPDPPRGKNFLRRRSIKTRLMFGKSRIIVKFELKALIKHHQIRANFSSFFLSTIVA